MIREILKKNNLIRYFLIIMPVIYNENIFSQEWKLQRNTEGIVVYTRPVAGTDLSMFRSQTRVKTSLSSLVAIWSTPTEFVNWMYTCKEASLLQKETRQTYIIYIVSSVPWPLPSRDNILRSALTQDKKTGKITIELTGMPDFIEKKKNLIRAPRSFGKVEMIPLGNGEVDVSFEFFMNPGGMIPAPIVNLFLLDFPFFTLKKMKEAVQIQLFQSARFDFITEF